VQVEKPEEIIRLAMFIFAGDFKLAFERDFCLRNGTSFIGI